MDDVALLCVGINQGHIGPIERNHKKSIVCCFDLGKDIKVPYGQILLNVSVGRSVFAQQPTDIEHLMG